MTALSIAGGVYRETSVWPEWNQIYGSGGRAAAALDGHVSDVNLYAYCTDEMKELYSAYAEASGFSLHAFKCDETIEFHYTYGLSEPRIVTPSGAITINRSFEVTAPTVLRFGMIEGSAVVHAERCIYDPQSPVDPVEFEQNKSFAKELVIVGNASEIQLLGQDLDPVSSATALCAQGAKAVVIKEGAHGAKVVVGRNLFHIPAYRSSTVWKVGTGDVFSAVFAYQWGCLQKSVELAADTASRAVADYAGTMTLPSPRMEDLAKLEQLHFPTSALKAYLAGPFFTIGQRLLIDSVRSSMSEIGISVFSPIHDVGRGEPDVVAPKDLDAIEQCDALLAIADGLDAGTLFEIGYARAIGRPVYVFSQMVTDNDLTMIRGSGCKIYDDITTAIYHMAWRI